ncbi:MAG: acyl carrier protein [Deltaproteobacteria bacterium]|nr:acyl carrier protein [Deltaproteobacteria bacterium]
MDIEATVRTYIAENFAYRGGAADLPASKSLIDAGIVDSTGVLELVSFVEQEFGIAVGDTEVVPENFDSIANLTAYIQRKSA